MDADVRRVVGYRRWALRSVSVAAVADVAIFLRCGYLLLTSGADARLVGGLVTSVAFAVFLVQWGTVVRRTRVVAIPQLSGSGIVVDGAVVSPQEIDGAILVDDRFMLGPLQGFGSSRGLAAAVALRSPHDGVATLLVVGPGAASFFAHVNELGFVTAS